MKRYILITAAVLALMSCNKEATDPSTDETGKGTYFTEGQQVTITCGPQQTKVNGTENASKGIDFTWEEGDKIKVTVSGSSSEFTLSAGAGTATATFTGQMPGSGTTFDVQFPVSDPVLTSQTYVAGGLPHNMMKFAKTGCDLGSAVALEAQYSALRLNIYGYNRQVTSITVTNTTADPNVSYTLTCSSPVQIGNTADEATPFHLVMPVGEYNFKAVVSCGAVTTGAAPLPHYIDANGVDRGPGVLVDLGTTMTSGASLKTFSTTSAKSFTTSAVINMPTLAMAQVWAPVNCGYDEDHTYGLMYQFGRVKGGSFNGSWEIDDVTYSEPDIQTTIVDTDVSYDSDGYNKNPDDDVFYRYVKKVNETHDWYTNIPDNQLEKWPMKEGDPGYVAGKIGNPCPNGWVVPELDDLGNLAFQDWDPKTMKGTLPRGQYNATKYGWDFEDLFLPKGGQRYYTSTSGGYGFWRPSSGFYTSRYAIKSVYHGSTFRRSYNLKIWAPAEGYEKPFFQEDANCSGNTVRCIKDMTAATVSASGFSEETTW